MPVSFPFDRVGHLTLVRVDVGGEEVPFLVDTGIGVSVVSTRLAHRLGLAPLGTSYSGRRMSGQVVTAPLVKVPHVTLGGFDVPAQDAAVVDLDSADTSRFEGILGLRCFEEHALTTDPVAMTLTVGASRSVTGGERVPLEIRRDGPCVDAYARLTLPDAQTITVEVDTGSGALILDAGYLDRGDITMTKVEPSTGVDETGYAWSRRRGVLSGAVHLEGAPETRHLSPQVIVQDIIHDGLVGTDYLERFRYTFDVAAEALVLSPLLPAAPCPERVASAGS